MLERFAGRYVLLRRLGQGGMGEVFLARDLTTGAECALKRLFRGGNHATSDSLRREFEALTRVRHPVLLRVHELGFAPDSTPYLTMEFVPGLPADRAVRRDDWASLAVVGARVAEALEALHAAQVAHGDLKPSNVLVVPDGAGGTPRDVRVVDFGLSALLGRDDQGYRGTPGFAAPEVVQGLSPAPAADLYGFGATLYALIAGRPPFQTDSATESPLERQRAGPPSATALELAGAPWPLIELIMRLMDPHSANRPGSAREARRELEACFPAARRPLVDRASAEVLVGRRRELARIEQWIAAAPRRPRILVFAGEAGIGKTALLSEVATRATLADTPVASWSCDDFREPGGVARAVSQVLAARATVAGAEPPRPFWPAPGVPIDAPALETWATGAAETAAAAVGGRGPLLVTLDDAESLDPVSRAWIRRLVLRDPPAAVLWLLARRDEPETDDEPRVLEQTGDAMAFVLEALDRDDARRLESIRLGAEIPDALEERLWQSAGGHPGMVVELLRAAASRGAVFEEEHGLSVRADLLESLSPRSDVDAARLERIGALEGPARDVVRALAIHETPIDEEGLRRLAPAATPEALRALSEAHLVRATEDGRWVLHPPRLASPVQTGMPDAARQALHRAALELSGLPPAQRFTHAAACGLEAEALDAAERSFAENPDARIAEHAAALAEPTMPERAADWWERAAECLRSRGRYAPMIPHLERALRLGGSPERRAARWQMLTTARLRANEPGRVEEVVALATAEGVAGRPLVRMRVDLASAHLAMGRLESGEREARQALVEGELAGDDAGVGLACEILAGIENGRGNPEAGALLLDRASESHARAGFVPGMVRVLTLRSSVARLQGRFDDAVRHCEEAITLGRTLSNRLFCYEAIVALTAVYSEAGRWTELLAVAVEATRMALEEGWPAEAAFAFCARSTTESLVGRPRPALRHARTAVRMCARFRPRSLTYAWRCVASAQRIRGRLREADRAARRSLAHAHAAAVEDAQWSRVEFGRVAAARERWDEASPVWESALARDPQLRSAATATAMVWLGRASVRRGDRERAESRLTLATSFESSRANPLLRASLRALKAELAFAGGRLPEGVTLGREALSMLDALPADRARVALDLSRAAPLDDELRAAVCGWLEEAARAFERLGDRRGRAQALSLSVEWLKRPAPGPGLPRLTGLFERVSWLISSVNELDELMRRAMRAAVDQLRAERGVLLLADPESGQLSPVAEYGAIEPTTRTDAVGYSRRVVERVTERGDSLLVVDAPTDPRAASQSVADMRVRSILCVPLFVGGRTVGAVYLDDTRRRYLFDEADRGLIEGFAHLMAVAIERSRRHDEVRREYERLEGENLSLRKQVGHSLKDQGMIGSSTPIQRVMAMAKRAANASATVLITGENGTGKELIARTLHHHGKRALRPFVSVNCGAIPASLVESELFGILANVATGVRARPGKFQLAHTGTLFLDEIGEMPEIQQVALLQALANREVTPVGGTKPVAVDVRIIAATNRNIRKLVEQGRFREDLYYRLGVIEIDVPPLRERKADIPDLVRHFVEQFARQQEREIPHLSPDFLAVLMRSDWPGNVRELQNYVERVMAMTPGNYLRPDPPPRDLERQVMDGRLVNGHRLIDAVSDVERRALELALDRANGNQSEAARQLGMKEQAVRYRMRKYGLTSPRGNRRVRRS